MCFSVLLLAAADGPPGDPTSYSAVGWIIVALAGIVAMANQGVDLWRKMFPAKSPPDHETYATKAEVLKLEQEHEEEMERIESRFEGWMEQQVKQHTESMTELRKALHAFGEWQMTIERALGHVETKADISLQQKAPRK
jgi:hypothetical protein